MNEEAPVANPNLQYARLMARAMADSYDAGLTAVLDGYDAPLRFQWVRRMLRLPLTRHVPGFRELTHG